MRVLGALGIVGLLISALIVASLATKQLTSTSKAGNAKQTIESANVVKNKAELKALSVKLNLYFSENGAYPKSLAGIDMTGLNTTSFQYSFCSSNSIIVTFGNENLVLNNGSENFSENSSQSHAACLSE